MVEGDLTMEQGVEVNKAGLALTAVVGAASFAESPVVAVGGAILAPAFAN